MSIFNTKKKDKRVSSAFFKHLENAHVGRIEHLKFSDCFLVKIVKAYSKPITRQTEEGSFMLDIKGNILNSRVASTKNSKNYNPYLSSLKGGCTPEV